MEDPTNWVLVAQLPEAAPELRTFLPSTVSAQWNIRKNRSTLERLGIFRRIAGRPYVNRPRYVQFLLAGEEAPA